MESSVHPASLLPTRTTTSRIMSTNLMATDTNNGAHNRLPSFTELTKTFGNRLQISTDTQQTQVQQPMTNSSAPPSARPQPPSPFSQQPEDYRFPPPPTTGPVPPPPGGVPNGTHISTHEQNYVARPVDFPPAVDRPLLPPLTDRRHSSPFVTAPMNVFHRPQDSYDSTTSSLNALADVASSNGAETRIIGIFQALDVGLPMFHRMGNIIADLHRDFHNQVAITPGNWEATDGSPRLVLRQPKANAKGEMLTSIPMSGIKSVLYRIPPQALQDSVVWSEQVREFLKEILAWREDEDANQARQLAQAQAQAQAQQQQQQQQQQAQPQIQIIPQAIPQIPQHNDITKTTTPSHRRHGSVSSPKRVKDGSVSKPKTNVKRVKPKTVISAPHVRTTQPQDNLNKDLSLSKPAETQSCKQCGSEDTPEWRRGPYGPRTLCNACGLFWGKLQRRFTIEKSTQIMMKRRDEGKGDDRRLPMDDGA